MAPVNISDLINITKLILNRYGVPDKDAEIITDSIIYAHTRGKHTHGVNRLPIYQRKINNGLMSPETTISIIKDTPVVAVLDANHGFGQVAGSKGMNISIEKADKYGVGVVGIRNSNSFGTAGYLAEMAVKHEMIGIVLGNSAPAIAPWGGKTPLLGTNPIGIAFPQSNGKPPIVLDMATSVIARSKIRLAEQNKEKIPLGWAFDCKGNPTDDPIEALKGSMVPIGEHKGYGLALAIDIIAGLLTGSAFGGDVKPLNSADGPSCFGHMLITIKISYFIPYEEYIQKIDALSSNIKSCGDISSVYLPGEVSFNKNKDKEILDLPDAQIDGINNLAKDLNIALKIAK